MLALPRRPLGCPFWQLLRLSPALARQLTRGPTTMAILLGACRQHTRRRRGACCMRAACASGPIAPRLPPAGCQQLMTHARRALQTPQAANPIHPSSLLVPRITTSKPHPLAAPACCLPGPPACGGIPRNEHCLLLHTLSLPASAPNPAALACAHQARQPQGCCRNSPRLPAGHLAIRRGCSAVHPRRAPSLALPTSSEALPLQHTPPLERPSAPPPRG